MIEDETNQLYLSPISVWEALLLAEKKRVVLEPKSSLYLQTFFQFINPVNKLGNWWNQREYSYDDYPIN
ncbi:hypothetical protein PN466_12805 [Roseofilum reptotaenium CS-1145]|uniref:hypothetical protein n=1 Tax=Roseofilum sp. Guam TaxID=2821502 RepID=UPI000A5EDAD0|nr:hypothetical protein [Roseofilum sp. Guam]MBP0030208.1 hypothetical protein [Roseofilum sp. Guam]MDB9517827.1 hypothetical protein [Roseofilum reptotaenium CS-1145]